MEIDGAVVSEQGITFAIVVVDYAVIDDHKDAQPSVPM